MLPLAAGGGANVMFTVCCSAMWSVVSVAVSVNGSEAESATANTTAPLDTDDTPPAGVIAAWLPLFAASATIFPLTLLPLASSSATTTTASDVPSAGTDGNGTGTWVPPIAAVEYAIFEKVALGRPAGWALSNWCNTSIFGEPKPTCAKSLAIEPALWKALVSASG